MSKIESVVYGTLVMNVETRSVSNGTKTIWEVITQDGTKWATFNTALGNKALSLKGQLADLKIAIEQKDSFTNYYLNDIQPAKGVHTQGGTAQQVQPQSEVVRAAEQARDAQVVTYDQYKDLASDQEKRKNESIHRQVAAKVSAALQPADDAEFWSNVQVLLNFFQTGAVPGSVTSHTDLAAGSSFDEPPELTDDDIPF